MAEMPKVSILLPPLNQREFLEPRVRSLLEQTFSDWETIVLDSGSTDGSWEFFQSIAKTDSRFHLHQIPREGLYAALNRGLELVTGEFIHIATADDSMSPEFLDEMLKAFSTCPEADIAACDLHLINRAGNKLGLDELCGLLTKRGAKNLLSHHRVRAAVPGEVRSTINYRPVPHDCLLHFDGRSVYFSLNQLLIRTSAARAIDPFDTTIGSVADFVWLLRLTSAVGTVHVPKKLAMWRRFHGEQLSIQRDESRAGARRAAAERVLVDLCRKNPDLLSANGRWEHREAFYSNVLKRAAFVVVGTEAGKNEVQRFYNVPDEKIRILPHPTPSFALDENKADPNELAKFKLPRDYVFYPAQFWTHKNHAAILRAVAQLRKIDNLRLPVVFTGSDQGNERAVRDLADQLQLRDQVFFLGHVSREELKALYQNALCLCYVSFFGPENLPPLEAFGLGCPVIAADVPGASEQLADAAIRVDPSNDSEIASALKLLAQDKAKREELIRRGKVRARRFTGPDFAKGLIALLDEFEASRVP